jgi:hypothetical protein
VSALCVQRVGGAVDLEHLEWVDGSARPPFGRRGEAAAPGSSAGRSLRDVTDSRYMAMGVAWGM